MVRKMPLHLLTYIGHSPYAALLFLLYNGYDVGGAAAQYISLVQRYAVDMQARGAHTAVPKIDMVKITSQRVYQVGGSSETPEKKKIHRQLTGFERNPNRSGVPMRTSMLCCATG